MLVRTQASWDYSELHVDDLLPPGSLLCPNTKQHAAPPLPVPCGPKNTQKPTSTDKTHAHIHLEEEFYLATEKKADIDINNMKVQDEV